MELWHLTPDAPRDPRRVRPGEPVNLQIGTWPIEPGQTVWVTYRVVRADGSRDAQRIDAAWQRNDGANSFWRVELGLFAQGDRVTVRTHCPGMLTWQVGSGEPQTVELLPAGGVMAGVQRYHLRLGPFSAKAGEVRFCFRCAQPGCDGRDICCKPDDYVVRSACTYRYGRQGCWRDSSWFTSSSPVRTRR